MRILIDTNILADALLGRDPYYTIAFDILTICAEKKVRGYIAAHSIPNLFYILRKHMSKEERREALKDICMIVRVENIDACKILSALDNEEFSDFEDCLQEECAMAVSADYIVTRNLKDFAFSKVPAVSPEEFISKVNSMPDGS